MSDTDDLIARSKQLGPTSTWGKTPRQLRREYNPDSQGQWGGGAIHASAVELTQSLPSRSAYRTTDAPIDTVAGMVLNTNQAAHESWVEAGARYGDQSAIDTVKRAADAGYPRAQAFLKSLAGAPARAMSVTVDPVSGYVDDLNASRAATGLSDRLPTSVADLFTPVRRGWIHTVATLVLAVLATVVQFDSATWTPPIVGLVVAVFDLGVSIAHSRSTLRSTIYGVILALQPIAVILHLTTDAQWSSGAALLAAVFGGALAAAKTPKW